MKAPLATSIDDYLATFPKEVQARLKQMRTIIHKAAPRVEEKISYGMPAFSLNGKNLIYFAGYKQHIGLYGVPDTKEFQKEFVAYKTSGRGTIQFPLDKPLPVALISKIVKYRIQKVS